MAPNFTIAKMVDEAIESGRVGFSAGEYGRPLLHSEDAGRALLLLCEHEAAGAPFTGRTVSLFDVLLLPGSFTPFSRFAEVVSVHPCVLL